MLKRSKSVWTVALTLASVALIASAGAQAQGKSAGKGKGAEKAQAAWTAPGHVNAKGNGHANHKGNGYGHGVGDPILPEGCYAAAAVTDYVDWGVAGAIMTEDNFILADYSLVPGDNGTDVYIRGLSGFQILNYVVSAFSADGVLLDSASVDFRLTDLQDTTMPLVDVGPGNYEVDILVSLCGDLSQVADPA